MSTTIKLTATGPLVVDGEFRLVDADGNEYGLGGRTKISLCTCGQSTNGPFCDGSHNRVECGWSRQARDLPPKL